MLIAVKRTYTNPLHGADAPDPFVLKYCGRYWCYCTGRASDDRCFPLLTSTDLVSWTELGGAMPPLDEEFTEYWAPEVTYWNGQFYMYYSAGDGTLMQLRVAVSDQPSGPFRDSGTRLTAQEFAIDPHVFERDGEQWLFYATDFLSHSHVGTGTVKDRLVDPLTPAGHPVPVVRARYDWHLFDPHRAEKGGARWHTVEGPTVLRHKGLFYEMFSGGNWKTESYGVGYAVSERLDAGAEWTQACDGVGVLPLLRTVEGVIGPGHNSVVRGPDNRQLYCVYHRWDTEAGRRQLAIDPLEWIGDELTVFGPTNDARPAPNLPAISWPAGSSEVAAGAHAGWTTNAGHWSFEAATVRQNSPEGYCEIWRTGNLETGFVIECDVHVAEWTPHGTIGLYVTDSAGRRVRFSLTPEGRWLFRTGSEDRMNSAAGNGQRKSPFLGTAFIRLTASGQTLEFYPRQSAAPCRIPLHGPPKSLGLFTNNVSGDFSSFALTRGWHDTFERPEDNLADLGFETRDDGWAIVPMELRHETAAPPGIILKPAPPEPYEFVVNARLEKPEEGTYGFLPAAELDAPGPLVALRRGPDGYVLCLDRSGGSKPGDAPVLATLPSTFDAARYQQFSCIVDGSHMQIRWRGNPLCQTRLDRAGSRVGLYARGRAAFDMIRVTELTYGDRW